MKNRYEEILKAALALPESERVFLIDDLLESLPPDTGPLSDDEMSAELERRAKEIEQGLVKPIPWEEVRKQLWEGE
jgi:putative addiction module component (TIGR02574 family)